VSASGNGRAGAPGSGAGRRGTAIAIGAALVVAVAALVVVAVRGPSRPPTFQERVHAIAENLRCPVCQNLSVGDSPSELAQQMRGEIGRRLRAGQTRAQIDAFFTGKYGRWILLTPDAGGIGLVAWLAPALAIAVGGTVAWTVVRRRRRGRLPGDMGPGPDDQGTRDSAEPRLTDAERDRIQREIAELEEVP
jgi:cytochrome c-type biogenesis protein CcmH